MVEARGVGSEPEVARDCSADKQPEGHDSFKGLEVLYPDPTLPLEMRQRLALKGLEAPQGV